MESTVVLATMLIDDLREGPPRRPEKRGIVTRKSDKCPACGYELSKNLKNREKEQVQLKVWEICRNYDATQQSFLSDIGQNTVD